MALDFFSGGGSGGGSTPQLTGLQQEVLSAYQSGMPSATIAKQYGISMQQLQGILSAAGVNYSVSPSSPAPTRYVQSGRPANVYTGAPLTPTSANPPAGDPRGPPPPGFTSWAQYDAYQAALNANANAGAASAASSAAADLAEKKREFDLTYQRDIAKQNASEVDALQKMLSGMNGPKDVYGDLFFSHGLAAPQGYKPAPIPLTQAQTAAYSALGVNPQQLQQMLTGNGQPGADTGMLGNLGSSLQPQPGQPGFTPVNPSQIQQSGPANPTQQGGALFGKSPAGSAVTGATPAMAVGGEVPGPVGDPRLIVAHGGEEVDNDTDQGELAPMNQGGVHPAIQKLMDALSELLANPDFQQFAGVAGKAAAISKPAKGSQGAKKAGPQGSPLEKMAPGPTVTPGGMQSMATGGTVNSGAAPSPSLNPTPPIQPSPVPQATNPSTTSGANAGAGTALPKPPTMTGTPLAGAQAVKPNAGFAQPADQPIMPIANMDPYTRALYDVHGRLHPYSAQQLQQMGPQGQQAVESYVGKVLGGDVKAYTDLADRLKPIGAPEASAANVGGGFKFG